MTVPEIITYVISKYSHTFANFNNQSNANIIIVLSSKLICDISKFPFLLNNELMKKSKLSFKNSIYKIAKY